MKNIIISLFDYSGSWSAPYARAGYEVVKVDIKAGQDILTWDYTTIPRDRVAGILAAPPCTDFTNSGAQYWPQKDADGTTALSVALVLKTLEIIKYFNPIFWALENPKGRLNKCVPELKPYSGYYWNPWQFGDPWTKETGIWGVFNKPERNEIPPVKWSQQGSWTQLLGGKSERTKEIRSITPGGFAQQFFEANNPTGAEIQERLNMFGRCKFGMWTCSFVVCQSMCDMCEDADNYEPEEDTFEHDSEEDLMLDIFDKGRGILRQAELDKKPY